MSPTTNGNQSPLCPYCGGADVTHTQNQECKACGACWHVWRSPTKTKKGK